MKTEHILKNTAITVGILAFIGVIIAAAYSLLFISTDRPLPQTYAAYGDFLGDMLNPLLAIINICVFVYLTNLIQQATSKSHKDNINTSKWIALLNLNFDEFKHFRQEVDRALDSWIAEPTNEKLFQEFLRTYNVQEYRLLILVPSLDEIEHNRSIRKYIGKAYNAFASSELKEAASCTIPISNTYGMLIKELGTVISCAKMYDT